MNEVGDDGVDIGIVGMGGMGQDNAGGVIEGGGDGMRMMSGIRERGDGKKGGEELKGVVG